MEGSFGRLSDTVHAGSSSCLPVLWPKHLKIWSPIKYKQGCVLFLRAFYSFNFILFNFPWGLKYLPLLSLIIFPTCMILYSKENPTKISKLGCLFSAVDDTPRWWFLRNNICPLRRKYILPVIGESVLELMLTGAGSWKGADGRETSSRSN